MKTIRSSIVLVALLATVSVSAQSPVPSRVTEATVFLQGAELVQTASATLKKGTNEISVEGLSPNLDLNSVKVNIGGGVVVSAFDFSIDYLAQRATPSARLKMLKDSIDIYDTQLSKINVDIKINNGMQSYLETGIAKNVSGSEAGLGIDELKQTMDYYSSKSGEILNGARELQKKRTATLDALNRVHRQYNEESGQAGSSSGVLALHLSSPAAGSYPVTITYFTPLASWSPYYEVNVASTDKPITFAAKARVGQTTGLDWTGVKLTLSTSVPGRGNVAPLFSTWFLREKQFVLAMGVAPAARNAYSYDMSAVDLAEVVVSEPVAKTIYDYVTSTESALDVTYNIDLPYSIPGNGKAQSIDLSVKKAAAEYKYYCAPKLDGSTYLIAEIAQWEKLGLLSAPAGITYNGTYVGETRIDASQTDEKLTLTLGTDKRVAVTREIVKEFSATKAVGNSTERTFTYRLSVRNGQTGPVTMVLKDQYPVSTDKNIVVTLDTKTTTPPTTNKPETGVVTWEEELAAGATKTYTLSYTVRYPKDMAIEL